MKERIYYFLKTYLLLIGIFVVQKPLFMLFYYSLYADCSLVEWLQVMWHGLPLDLSLAGYLTLLPGLWLIATSWTLSEVLRRISIGYFAFISLLLSTIFVVDLGLYDFWRFRLDATPLFYFFSSPKDALASVSVGFVLAGLFAIILFAVLLFLLFYQILLNKSSFLRLKLPFHAIYVSGGMLLLTALLFIPIRGGFTVSTMNTGKVYFSTNVLLNHAATNPAFNLIESLSKQKDFAKQYRFMDDATANHLFTQLVDPAVYGKSVGDSLVDPARHLFTEQRPNICLIIWEGFSSKLMQTLGGCPDVAVQMDSLTHEGVLFTNFYANSFRTDRGLVSVLSGYPAQPTTSIMKYPLKTANLPAIARSLRKVGYRANYYYGGDADFTNMRSYLMASGFESIVSDQDFPVSDRLSKWGAHDHLVFRRLLTYLKQESSVEMRRPFYCVLQTSSSHEPFEVPYRRLVDDRMNSFAYTDSCVGDFIRQFKELPQWKHTVVIIVPDHLGATPEPVSNFSIERYQIPLLLLGGALQKPDTLDVYGSQQDIAATLLAQLGLPHDEFIFSKDLLNPHSPHFAFFTVPDAFGVATPDNQIIYDNQSDQVVYDEGSAKGKNLQAGKAYLQKLYDDLARRGISDEKKQK